MAGWHMGVGGVAMVEVAVVRVWEVSVVRACKWVGCRRGCRWSQGARWHAGKVVRRTRRVDAAAGTCMLVG